MIKKQNSLTTDTEKVLVVGIEDQSSHKNDSYKQKPNLEQGPNSLQFCEE